LGFSNLSSLDVGARFFRAPFFLFKFSIPNTANGIQNSEMPQNWAGATERRAIPQGVATELLKALKFSDA
jgi:hypothetical protein